MKFLMFLACLSFNFSGQSQSVADKLDAAMKLMEKEDQFAHASIGLYVINSKTGAVVFDKNAQLGLAPASTQKVVTSAAAYELLGKDFTYSTGLSYDGTVSNNILKGDIIIHASGDPTLGSWRWNSTSKDSLFAALATAFKQKNIKFVNGLIELHNSAWESQATPNGWIWEDVGNYYGAGAHILNWHENSYNLELKPGKNVGDSVKILKMEPPISLLSMINELKTAKAGSGDNAIIYLPERGMIGVLRGTIPAGTDKFVIKGSMPMPETIFVNEMRRGLLKSSILLNAKLKPYLTKKSGQKPALLRNIVQLHSFSSPPLDSINYWFMKESINLYGEAFIKTIAHHKKGFGSTADGLDIIKELWKSKGIKAAELKIKDGSGLSPANRLTPHALVEILQYASKQSWFNSFHHSLPLQNGIKMKSGYIGGVRSYAGYVKSKTGEEYTFAFIINNFDGSPSSVREKMWKMLDLLK
ncbi:MAG: D-alanyl-D-alanine carboxypeptidase/D-alanyl-D-alanine-endopeptidase [Sphingobacteriales bacterium]|nr:MAG: D-alanyl-D-alanine carboxypeptidase/D-alanyl-D-alanine-endopeptidase [Sphingobacteriales bacterium]